MTARPIVRIDCDYRMCDSRFDSGSRDIAVARTMASERGWSTLHQELDICGHHGREMKGHSPVVHEHPRRHLGVMYSVSCGGCDWQSKPAVGEDHWLQLVHPLQDWLDHLPYELAALCKRRRAREEAKQRALVSQRLDEWIARHKDGQAP